MVTDEKIDQFLKDNRRKQTLLALFGGRTSGKTALVLDESQRAGTSMLLRDFESGATLGPYAPADIQYVLKALAKGFAAGDLEAMLDRAERAEAALAELRAAGSEWVELSKAPIGKYDGPTVLAARDRFAAALRGDG